MSISRAAKTVAVLAAGAALVATSGCGGSSGSGSGSKTTVTWSTWGNPEELARFKAFEKDFGKRHPDINLKLQAVPSYSDYHAKLLTQLSSKTAPDVFYIGDDFAGKFVSAGVLAPLNDKMAAPDSKAKPEDFFDGLYGGAKKDGQIYGIPNDANPEVLWYDKQTLKDAGITDDPAALNAQGKWTMATFLDMNRKLKAADKAGSVFYNWYGSTYSMINGFGGKVYDGGKFVGNTDPKSREALKTLADGYQDKTFLVADLLPEGNGSDVQFIKHKVGFAAGGRWMIDTVKKGQQDNYDIVPFPSQTGVLMPQTVGTSFLAMNKDTKKAQAAWTFMSEFVSKDGQLLRLKGGGNAVPSVKGADSVVMEGYPAHAQTFIDTRDGGFANYPEEAGVPSLTSDINEHLLKLWTGKIGFDQAMNELGSLVSAKLH